MPRFGAKRLCGEAPMPSPARGYPGPCDVVATGWKRRCGLSPAPCRADSCPVDHGANAADDTGGLHDVGVIVGPSAHAARGRLSLMPTRPLAQLTTIGKIRSLLTPRQRLFALGLFGAITVMALLQVAGIASIGPFLALVADPSVIERNQLLQWAYNTFGFESETAFLVFVGFGVLAVFTASNLFAMFTTWLLMRFTWNFNYTLSRKLLAHYLNMPYAFFLGRNSSDLGKNVLAEVREVISGVMVPGMQALAKGAAAVAIIALLIALDPLLALATATILGGAYLIIYVFVRRRLSAIGKERFEANTAQYQTAAEGLSGIKEIKLLGSEPVFLARYADAARRYARVKVTKELIGKLPHYLIEILAFGGLLLIVMYLLVTQGDVRDVIPLAGLYVFASYRLLPALREVFSGVTKVRYAVPALDRLHSDLQQSSLGSAPKRSRIAALPCRDSITLRNITYRYPGADEPVLHNFTLTAKASTSVALVGPTGSGKTTTVDIILGLLEPQRGELLVDGTPITRDNLPNWQKNLGYVPQHIYLLDDTVARNIAFGAPEGQLDMAAVERAARIANIHEFIVTELPEGYDTKVGERGIRLSGGQRQRIGIARALYRDPSVLVLDEATSALDTVTEDSVFAAVQNIARTKTVLMIAHRLSTIRGCDVVHMLDKGRIAASGTYHELLKSSPEFRAMARGKDPDAVRHPEEVRA